MSYITIVKCNKTKPYFIQVNITLFLWQMSDAIHQFKVLKINIFKCSSSKIKYCI